MLNRFRAICVCFMVLLVMCNYSFANEQGNNREAEMINYQGTDNWLVRPSAPCHEAALFYLYPSCYNAESDGGELISTIDSKSMRDRAQYYIPTQISLFADIADLYAPYYRQCDVNSLNKLSYAELEKRFNSEPKADIFAALDEFFAEIGDKPYFLASHSQGSVMMCLVLSEYMSMHPEHYKNMIAAYVIGWSVTRGWLRNNPHLKFAEGEGDTGVIISYNTEGPENDGKINLVLLPDSCCINPLNWKTDETYAPVSMNLGSLEYSSETGSSIVPGIADARINAKRGVVICSSADPEKYAHKRVALFGPQSFHGWDYKFYYENLRENAKLRLANYLKKRK